MNAPVRVVRLPDVGEGVAEAEIVAWHVAVGDTVTSDSIVAEVLTDKATVEIYAPVAGRVAALFGQAGDVLAVGSDFFTIETESGGTVFEPGVAPSPSPVLPDIVARVEVVRVDESAKTWPLAASVATSNEKTGTAAPAIRERARRLRIELGTVAGTGPAGQVTHEDLDRLIQRSVPTRTSDEPTTATAATQIPLIGLRRKIAERLTVASSRIPHITYVDEIDMTRVEQLRTSLAKAYPDHPRLTVLPLLMRAVVRAVADQPQINATFDDEAEVLTTFASVHIGIATQTPKGLIVPVVRDVDAMDLWRTAAELARVTTAARNGTAQRSELSGSTITITSLGALGGLVTTPIINHPEVAIIGVNKMQTRPTWDGNTFVPRLMMNLSSSFDHRIVDGWDAATFVQRIKVLLEEPSLLFLDPPTTTVVNADE